MLSGALKAVLSVFLFYHITTTKPIKVSQASDHYPMVRLYTQHHRTPQIFTHMDKWIEGERDVETD